jgi:hypothetical protein
MPRCKAILLLAAALFAAALPAFSAEAPARATPPSDDIDPATGLSRSTVVRPLRPSGTPARSGAEAPAQAREPVAAGARPHIALILPIASPSLGGVADAVRQGFIAAAEAAGANAPPVTLVNVADDGPAVLEACRRAQSLGAMLVVAGITRDGATGLARSDCPRIPVLALNQPQDPDLPQNLYSISLSLEQEARQAALLAVADGWQSAIVIAAPTPLARRVQEAFEREWTRAAGEVRGRAVFSGNPEETQAVKEKIAAIPGDMVFIALDQAAARTLRPYISGMLPIYATSLSIDPRADPTVNVDLQGVRYVDMPWFVQPDHPAVMVYSAPRTPMSVERERLYALGIDAYRLAVVLAQGELKRLALDGVTGRIALEGQHFSRTLTPAEVDGGRVSPIKH